MATMNTPSTKPVRSDAQRAGVRRTALILGAYALAAYVLFLYSVMGPK